MNVIASGYSGTGSSAIVHLLSEYEDFSDGISGSYEHVLFYIPDGLFDLEDRLLYNNTLHMADGAINRFYSAMKRLNDNDFGWFGGYENRYGKMFMQIVDEFLEELVDFKLVGYWSDDFKLQSSLQATIKDTAKKITGHKVTHFGKKISKNGDGYVLYSFPNQERFYRAAKEFVLKYLRMICNNQATDLVLDQILLPQNLYRLQNYFDNSKAIVVDRDPRDLFVLSKYVWPKITNSAVLFPENVGDFIEFYKEVRKQTRRDDPACVMTVRFEDLIYNYDETINRIESYLKIDSSRHTRKQTRFNPEKSIANTQNFRMNSHWTREVEAIRLELSEYLYEFPYILHPSINEASDPS
jgi:hypothetical protein